MKPIKLRKLKGRKGLPTVYFAAEPCVCDYCGKVKPDCMLKATGMQCSECQWRKNEREITAEHEER